MRSLKYFSPWNVSLQEVERPRVEQPDEVVIDIAYSGICGTDVGIVTGCYAAAVPGVTIGHESSGIVAEVGPAVIDLAVGDRVVINPTYHCGTCRMCRSLRVNHCEKKAGTEAGVSYDGTFSGAYKTARDFLIPLPDHLSLQEATMTEPLSCAVTGLRKIPQIVSYERCMVIGSGPMGLLYTWALSLRGYRPLVVETSAGRRGFAAGVLPADCDLCEELEDALGRYPDGRVDLVIDTTSELLEMMVPRLAPGGMYFSIGLKSKMQSFDSLLIADRSLNVVGSIDSQVRSFEEAFALISGGHIPVRGFISQELPLEAYQDAFALLGCSIKGRKLEPVSKPVSKVLLSVAGG